MPPAPLSPLPSARCACWPTVSSTPARRSLAALRVSRTTVWKALQGLEEWGVTLFKVHGRGYRLVTPVDWLDAQQINRHLGAHQEELQVHVVDTVDSTNSLLLAEAQAGAPSGLAVAAELQTRGRGRRGRGWHTGLGDALTFSLLWRFRAGRGCAARAEPGGQRGAGARAARAGRDRGHGEVAQRRAVAPAQAGRRADRSAGRVCGPERRGDRDRHQRAPGRERPRAHRPAGGRPRRSRRAAASQSHPRAGARRARRGAERVLRRAASRR